jgi:hypothetical protein
MVLSHIDVSVDVHTAGLSKNCSTSVHWRLIPAISMKVREKMI